MYFCRRFYSESMDVIEIVGAVIGLIYLFLEYKAHVCLWPVGILMSLFYVVIFFYGKFYADAALNLYYIGANVYGWVFWVRNRKKNPAGNEEEIPITQVPARSLLMSMGVTAALWLAFSSFLKFLTDSVVPVGDGFTTSLSIVAMWMLSRKYAEQWLLWVVVDVVSVILYTWKGLYPTAVLYSIYTLIAAVGYLKWRKLAVTPSSSGNGL